MARKPNVAPLGIAGEPPAPRMNRMDRRYYQQLQNGKVRANASDRRFMNQYENRRNAQPQPQQPPVRRPYSPTPQSPRGPLPQAPGPAQPMPNQVPPQYYRPIDPQQLGQGGEPTAWQGGSPVSENSRGPYASRMGMSGTFPMNFGGGWGPAPGSFGGGYGPPALNSPNFFQQWQQYRGGGNNGQGY